MCSGFGCYLVASNNHDDMEDHKKNFRKAEIVNTELSLIAALGCIALRWGGGSSGLQPGNLTRPTRGSQLVRSFELFLRVMG